MLVEILTIVVLLGSGLTAGVLFAVALSVLPALFAMPTDRYIWAHTLIGRRWDPTMPIIVISSTIIDAVLAVLVDARAATTLFICAAALLGLSSYVSHFRNVPINRVVKSTDPERVPANWTDPRPLWRRWHLVRTTLAVTALGLNAVAATLL